MHSLTGGLMLVLLCVVESDCKLGHVDNAEGPAFMFSDRSLNNRLEFDTMDSDKVEVIDPHKIDDIFDYDNMESVESLNSVEDNHLVGYPGAGDGHSKRMKKSHPNSPLCIEIQPSDPSQKPFLQCQGEGSEKPVSGSQVPREPQREAARYPMHQPMPANPTFQEPVLGRAPNPTFNPNSPYSLDEWRQTPDHGHVYYQEPSRISMRESTMPQAPINAPKKSNPPPKNQEKRISEDPVDPAFSQMNLFGQGKSPSDKPEKNPKDAKQTVKIDLPEKEYNVGDYNRLYYPVPVDYFPPQDYYPEEYHNYDRIPEYNPLYNSQHNYNPPPSYDQHPLHYSQPQTHTVCQEVPNHLEWPPFSYSNPSPTCGQNLVFSCVPHVSQAPCCQANYQYGPNDYISSTPSGLYSSYSREPITYQPDPGFYFREPNLKSHHQNEINNGPIVQPGYNFEDSIARVNDNDQTGTTTPPSTISKPREKAASSTEKPSRKVFNEQITEIMDKMKSSRTTTPRSFTVDNTAEQ